MHSAAKGIATPASVGWRGSRGDIPKGGWMMAAAHSLFDLGAWRVTHREDQAIRALADRHYSRQTVGDRRFAPPGEGFFAISWCARAAWVVVRNRFMGVWRWRCTLFRNEGAGLSSDLVREATARTYEFWQARYGILPSERLTTEVDPSRTRRKRDPGRCFLRAGWERIGVTRGLVVLGAPSPC